MKNSKKVEIVIDELINCSNQQVLTLKEVLKASILEVKRERICDNSVLSNLHTSINAPPRVKSFETIILT